MSDAVIIALIVAVPTVFATLPALIISFKTLRQAQETHVLVNTNYSDLKKELAVALSRIDGFQALLIEIRSQQPPH
jgi:hypothetical protein